MKIHYYYFIFILFLIQILDSYAMQPQLIHQSSRNSVIAKVIDLKALNEVIAITSTEKDLINVIGRDYYVSWDWKTKKVVLQPHPILIDKQHVCFHPTKNKVFLPCNPSNGKSDGNKNAFFLDYEGDRVEGKCFHYPMFTVSSALFSREEPGVFLINEKRLIFYNYQEHNFGMGLLKNQLGTILSYPSDRRPYFLCTDYDQKKIYKLIPTSNSLIEKKIYEFSLKMDPSTFVYNSENGLFFCINKAKPLLYIVDINNSKKRNKYDVFVKNRKKKYRFGKAVSIAAMLLHPNKKILALFSQKNDLIEYVDINNYKEIRHVLTTHHDCLDSNLDDKYTAQKGAFSQDGRALFLARGERCFVIKVPSHISDIDIYNKFCLLSYFNLPLELRSLIRKFLLSVNECVIES